MNEYFIVANSFAAPFVSDTTRSYVKAYSPKAAMEKFIRNYSHPCGLYAANCYQNADDYHKKNKPLLVWESFASQEMKNKTGGSYTA